MEFVSNPPNLRPDIEKEICDVVRGTIIQENLLKRFLKAIQDAHQTYCDHPRCKNRYYSEYYNGKVSNKKPRPSKCKETIIEYLIKRDMYQLLNHWSIK